MNSQFVSDLRGPKIARDRRSEAFFDGTRRNELMIRRCRSCARWLGPEADACPGCEHGELTWVKARGIGQLVTWSVVHSPPHSSFADEIPYTTGYVELTEGPWLLARIIAAGPGALHAGAPMQVAFVHPSDGESYPVFTMETPVTPDCDERSGLRAAQSSPAPHYGISQGVGRPSE